MGLYEINFEINISKSSLHRFIFMTGYARRLYELLFFIYLSAYSFEALELKDSLVVNR